MKDGERDLKKNVYRKVLEQNDKKLVASFGSMKQLSEP
jgi:hypothetical protein